MDFYLISFYVTLFLSLNVIKVKTNDPPQCSDYSYNQTNHKCENNGNSLDYCRPHKGNDDWACYNCSLVFQTSTSRRYRIVEDNCQNPEPCNKISIENNECFNEENDECPEGTRIFGDYCYTDCGAYGLLDGDDNKCKCSNTYKIKEELSQDKKYYRCIESCPSGYYDKSDNGDICRNGQCSGDKKKRILDPNNIGCTNSCKNNDGKKRYIMKKGTNEEEHYCLDTCPDSAPFFYNEESLENEIECIDKCNDHDYYNSTTKECLIVCNETSLIDLSKNIRECRTRTQESTDECPDSFPYRYNKTADTFACLKDCSDTKTMFDKDTLIYYEYIEGKPKRYCINIDECQQKAYFIDNSTKMCVKDCRETQNIYNFNGECFSDCTPRRYHLYDTFECQVNCPDGNYTSESENTCYESCSNSSLNIYADPNQMQCMQTCSKPRIENDIQFGEGYIYYDSNTKEYFCFTDSKFV